VNAVSGDFWVPERHDVKMRGEFVKVRGEFKAEVGQKPEARLADGLVDDPQVKRVAGGVALTGSAADSVKAFQPITLRGNSTRVSPSRC
jgi:hypothetical protein